MCTDYTDLSSTMLCCCGIHSVDVDVTQVGLGPTTSLGTCLNAHCCLLTHVYSKVYTGYIYADWPLFHD